jgi:carboxylesterase
MEEGRTKTGPIFLKGDSGIGILLIHGWILTPDVFLPLAKYLNSLGYTVSAPLLRGHGTSPENLRGVIWQGWLKDSQNALQELKKNTSAVFICGVSMGGNMAMLLSEDESVAGVITMGASVKFHFQKLVRLCLFLMGVVKTYRHVYYPPWVRSKMGKHNAYTYYPVESAKEVLALAKHTRDNLSKIRKPILIMQSTSDHLVSRQSPLIICSGIKSEIKEIYWLKKTYHVFSNKKEVHEKIAEFISQVLQKK